MPGPYRKPPTRPARGTQVPDTGCATQPAPVARSRASRIRSIGGANLHRSTNERLWGTFVAHVPGPMPARDIASERWVRPVVPRGGRPRRGELLLGPTGTGTHSEMRANGALVAPPQLEQQLCGRKSTTTDGSSSKA